MESRNGATMNRSTENFGNKRLNLRWTPTGFQPIDPDDAMVVYLHVLVTEYVNFIISYLAVYFAKDAATIGKAY